MPKGCFSRRQCRLDTDFNQRTCGDSPSSFEHFRKRMKKTQRIKVSRFSFYSLRDFFLSRLCNDTLSTINHLAQSSSASLAEYKIGTVNPPSDAAHELPGAR